MTRVLSPQEKIQAQHLWPKMNVDAVVVTDEPTNRYNCLAWTPGITSSWIWPWRKQSVQKSDFDALYISFGFTPADSGEIAVFGLDLNSMTDGSLRGLQSGSPWKVNVELGCASSTLSKIWKGVPCLETCSASTRGMLAPQRIRKRLPP